MRARKDAQLMVGLEKGGFAGAFAGIMAAANAAAAAQPGHENDYVGEDGLLHCAACKEPRQLKIVVPLPGYGERIVGRRCACDRARQEAKEASERAREEMDKIEDLRRVGITDKTYRGKTFAADDGQDAKLSSVMRRYVEKRAEMLEKNYGLLLYGDNGGGKTFWASCIANAMIDKGVSALIATIPSLVSVMQADFEHDKQYILDLVSNVSFLVLDDIGFERRTPYMEEKMFEIIDARYRAKRPLIVTTNLTLEEIKNPPNMADKRIFNRIVEMCCVPIKVEANGRRLNIARDKASEARNLLGI